MDVVDDDDLGKIENGQLFSNGKDSNDFIELEANNNDNLVHYEDSLIIGEEHISKALGSTGTSRAKRHSLNTNTGQFIICPNRANDCKPNELIQFKDDCCSYCPSHDFCAQAKAQGLCHLKAECKMNILNETSSLEFKYSNLLYFNSTFECSCGKGFEGDGRTCLDIDECSSSQLNDCDQRSSICINTIGGYECKCRRGYREALRILEDGSRRETCLDIDECSEHKLNKCHKEAECSNIEGSFRCHCRAGYLGNGLECHRWLHTETPKDSLAASYIVHHSPTSSDKHIPLSDISGSDQDQDLDQIDSDSLEDIVETGKHLRSEKGVNDESADYEESEIENLSDSRWEPLRFESNQMSQQVSS